MKKKLIRAFCSSHNNCSTMSLQSCISQTILCGRILGLMPVRGICRRNNSKLQIASKFLRLITNTFILFGTFSFLVFITRLIFISTNASLSYYIVLIVYLGSFINVILFHQFGKQWPKLVHLWDSLEIKFGENSTNERQLQRNMNAILIVIITMALGKCIL